MIIQSLLVDVCTIWIFKRGWLVFETYDIESWLVDIWNIWLQSHGWLVFGTYNYSIMVGVVYVAGVLFAFLVLTIMNYFLLPSWSTGYLNLEYMISGFGDPVALHCTAFRGIWSYVANLWLRPYRYNIVYWA